MPVLSMATVGESATALRSGYSTDSEATKKPRPVGRRRLDVMIRAVENIFMAGGEAALHSGYLFSELDADCCQGQSGLRGIAAARSSDVVRSAASDTRPDLASRSR